MMMVSKTEGMTPLRRPHMQMESVEGQYRSSGQYDSVESHTLFSGSAFFHGAVQPPRAGSADAAI